MTRPCVPSASWIQSPTWMLPSSCSATPPRMLPSVACRLRARTPLTIADVVTTDEARRPDALKTPIAGEDVGEADDDVAGDRDQADADRRQGHVEDEQAAQVHARERGEQPGHEVHRPDPRRRRVDVRVREDPLGAGEEQVEEKKQQRVPQPSALGGREAIGQGRDEEERCSKDGKSPAAHQFDIHDCPSEAVAAGPVDWNRRAIASRGKTALSVRASSGDCRACPSPSRYPRGVPPFPSSGTRRTASALRRPSARGPTGGACPRRWRAPWP